MDEAAEPNAVRPISRADLGLLDRDGGIIAVSRLASSVTLRTSRLFGRRSQRARVACLPLQVRRFARRRDRVAIVGREDLLVAHAAAELALEDEHVRIPPHHSMRARTWHVQPRRDQSYGMRSQFFARATTLSSPNGGRFGKRCWRCACAFGVGCTTGASASSQPSRSSSPTTGTTRRSRARVAATYARRWPSSRRVATTSSARSSELARHAAGERLEPNAARRDRSRATGALARAARSDRTRSRRETRGPWPVHGHDAHALGAFFDDGRLAGWPSLGVVVRGARRRRGTSTRRRPRTAAPGRARGARWRAPARRSARSRRRRARASPRAAARRCRRSAGGCAETWSSASVRTHRRSVERSVSESRRSTLRASGESRPWACLIREQRVVGEREERAAQRRVDRELVVGPLDRGERVAHRLHLLALVKRSAADEHVRDAPRLERAHVGARRDLRRSSGSA